MVFYITLFHHKLYVLLLMTKGYYGKKYFFYTGFLLIRFVLQIGLNHTLGLMPFINHINLLVKQN